MTRHWNPQLTNKTLWSSQLTGLYHLLCVSSRKKKTCRSKLEHHLTFATTGVISLLLRFCWSDPLSNDLFTGERGNQAAVEWPTSWLQRLVLIWQATEFSYIFLSVCVWGRWVVGCFGGAYFTAVLRMQLANQRSGYFIIPSGISPLKTFRRQWDKTYSCYGNRETVTSLSDSVFCLMRVAYAESYQGNSGHSSTAKKASCPRRTLTNLLAVSYV